MKRILICALGVMVLAGVASAAPPSVKVWITPAPGSHYVASNHLSLLPSETAVIQLWIEVTSAAGYRLLDFQAITDSAFATETFDHFEVVGFNDQNPDGAGPFDRVDPRGLLDDGTPDDPDGLDGYQIVYYGGVGVPAFPFTSEDGLSPASGTYLLDEIIIHGVNDTELVAPNTATADKVTFRVLGGVQPSGYAIYTPFGTSSTYYDAVVTMQTGSPGGKGFPALNPLYVSVVFPEPASLSLLALGGLAALRRRR